MTDKQNHKAGMNGNQESADQESNTQQQTEDQQGQPTDKAQQADQAEEQETNQSDQEETDASGDQEAQGAEEQKDPLQQKQEEYQELYDKHLRLYSEFENFRRRSRKETADAKEKGRSDMVLAVLPVIDDFERALSSINESTESKEVYEGVELIYNKFKNILNEQGLQEMQPVGETFDPDYHEAMTKMQAPSEDQKGKVIDVVEKGYLLNDRIVRHAKVVVGE
jgi:molecular chaperone GrpE